MITARWMPYAIGSTRWSLVARSRPAPIATRTQAIAAAIRTPRRARIVEMVAAEADSVAADAAGCSATAEDTQPSNFVAEIAI